MPTLPVHVMIEPLMRQMELQGYQNLDFDFLLCLAKHPRLPLRHALLLAHQLGKLALNDSFYGRYCNSAS
jgi:hypothetical protein